MITEAVLEAYDALAGMIVNWDAHWVLSAIREMLCEFDEFKWETSSEEEHYEWLKQFLGERCEE